MLFHKKNNIIFTKKANLTKIFKVHKGKIAVFSVPYEQKHTHSELVEPVDVEILAITGEIGDYEELAAARAVADGIHLGECA